MDDETEITELDAKIDEILASLDASATPANSKKESLAEKITDPELAAILGL